MIKVTFKPMPTGSSLSDKITSMALNAAGEEYAKKIQEHVKGLKCTDHPSANQQVIVKADKAKTYIIEKNGFCCTKFKDSIRFTTK